MARLLHTMRAVRDFLFAMLNKEFLVFLFFLVISGAFWLLVTLNEIFEKEISVELRLSNIPKNVVFTEELPTAVRFTVRDKGYMIGGYLYGKRLMPITVSFATYADGKGHGTVPAADIQKLLAQQLYNTSKITSVKADKLEFSYNYGRNKKVAVRMLGTVSPASGYYLSQTLYQPDSVTVYASKQLLDSIQYVYTERQNIVHLDDTLTIDAPLRKIKNAKLEPATVRMKLIPDILTEETVEVPIQAIHLPEELHLRTFPQKVTVRFVVGANRLRTMPKNAETKALLPVGFSVVADYNTLSQESEKCPIVLQSTPSGIRNARLDVSEVDYLIEQP